MSTRALNAPLVGLTLLAGTVALPGLGYAQTYHHHTARQVLHARMIERSNQQPATPYILPPGAPDPNDISNASAKYSRTSVFVGGTPIMRVQFAGDGMTPEQRATKIQLRLNKILEQAPIRPDDITVNALDPLDVGVYVRGQLLFVADEQTAHADQMTPYNLAQEWAAAMRRTLPAITKA